MADSEVLDSDLWLPLGEASKQMGVSPQTLRSWADQGRVPAYRTPGGHRRFRVQETAMPAFRSGRRSDTRWRLLEHSALGRMRLALEAEPAVLAGGVLSPEARAEHRELGRALIHLLVLGLQQEHAALDKQTQQVGQAYVALLRQHGITPQAALTWLGFFRNAFVESVVEFAFGLEEPTADQINAWLRRVHELVDRVSVTIVENSA